MLSDAPSPLSTKLKAQSNKAGFFRTLHQKGNPFVLANAWDIGTARTLAGIGAQALGTTSAGHAFTLGLADMGNVRREEAIAHAAQLAAATPLPISADLENGYGHRPEDVAETVRQATAARLAGCSVEDTMLPDSAPYAFDDAVNRIAAAAQTARAATDDFVLTARADGIMNGHYDVDEAVRRLRAFAEVGADVLYAPLLPTMETVKHLCDTLSAPINVLATGTLATYRVTDFASIGVARISLGGGLARVGHAAIVQSARSILQDGDLSSLQNGADGDEIDALLKKGTDAQN